VTPYSRRLDNFREKLRARGLTAAFLPEGANLEYLTGVPRARHVTDPSWDPELVVEGCFIGIEEGPYFLLTHSEWSLPAATAVAPYHTDYMPADANPVDWLANAAAAVGAGGTVAVDDRTSLRQLEALRDALPDVTFVPGGQLVLELRASKDDQEVEQIRSAGEITLSALEETLARFGTSFGRRDFLIELEFQLLLRGSERLAYAPDLHASGPQTAIGWSADVSGNTNARITAPAAVTVDVGAVVGGYRADVGRTFYVGEPQATQLAALDSVRRAQDAAIATLRPGIEAEDVDRAARAIMEADGLGDAFWIPSGHGIGLEVHEPPRFRRGSTEVVSENAVVAVEVAAWRESSLSAFWEDDVLVRSSGVERLTEGPSTPLVLS
jgi:Xaa-Pro aminopeptidase